MTADSAGRFAHPAVTCKDGPPVHTSQRDEEREGEREGGGEGERERLSLSVSEETSG